MITAKNPILPGFHPDPSICRVGEDFYLVNSTFSYFPGVPVYHSKDLAHWEQIGNVLERDSQVPLTGFGISRGIFAPTIRHHQGKFYMITTNVSSGGNFIVTADRPEGPWSEPYYLGEDAPGIDPSLFFDTDGTCYYIGQREKPVGCRYYGDTEIWIRKLNTDTMRMEGETAVVLDGFQKNAVWSEGPHLYHIGDYYYILHAESGTAFHHCVVAARSKNVFGPYEYCPCNPILTHRHLGAAFPVTCVGHADLVDDVHGNWYMIMLACRPQEGHTLLGRETFLAKVEWEDGWPVVNPGVGHLEETVELPLEEKCAGNILGAADARHTFGEKTLPPCFLSLKNDRDQVLSLTECPGALRLFMRESSLKDLTPPAYLGVRWLHKAFEAEALFTARFAGEDDCAGMALVQSEQAHIRVEYFQKDQKRGLRVIRCAAGEDVCVSQKDDVGGQTVALKLVVHGLAADVWAAVAQTAKEKPFSLDDVRGSWQPLAKGMDLTHMSTESAGGFVGCTVGMYASGNGKDDGGYADFAEFSYHACGGKE